jgi:hypothetical protein
VEPAPVEPAPQVGTFPSRLATFGGGSILGPVDDMYTNGASVSLSRDQQLVTGRSSVKFSTGGAVSNGIARLNWENGFAIKPGDMGTMGYAQYLPVGTYAKLSGIWDVFRLVTDDVNRSDENRIQLQFSGRTKEWKVIRVVYNGSSSVDYTTLMTFPQDAIPEGGWNRIAIQMKTSRTDGQALTAVYVNGRLVGRSTAHNINNAGYTSGNTLTCARYGFASVFTSGAVATYMDELFMTPNMVTR